MESPDSAPPLITDERRALIGRKSNPRTSSTPYQSTYKAGLTAAYVAEMGVLAARAGAGGTFADISMSECLTSELALTIPEYSFIGALSARRPRVIDPFSSGAPLYAGSGFVSVQINTQMSPADFVDLVGDVRLADQRFGTTGSRAVHAAELDEIFGSALSDRDPRDFFVDASRRGLLVGLVQDAAQLVGCPQLESRQVFVDMPGRLAGKPWRMPTAVPLPGIAGTRPRPAPLLGEHTAAVLDTPAVTA